MFYNGLGAVTHAFIMYMYAIDGTFPDIQYAWYTLHHKCILDSGFGFKKLFIYCYYFYNILGFVCDRKDLSASGCCHSGGESTRRYECTDCQSNNCCSIYEHCVSCCLSPDNVSSKKWFTEYIYAFSSRSQPSINPMVYLFMYIVLVTLKWSNVHGSSQASGMVFKQLSLG